MKPYNYSARRILILATALLFLLGVFQDPKGLWTSMMLIPTGFAKVLPWVVVTFGFIWLACDLVAKYALGKSLREYLQAKDERFEQSLIVALVIAIPLIMLIAQ